MTVVSQGHQWRWKYQRKLWSYNRATLFGLGCPPTSPASFAKIPINLKSFCVLSTSMLVDVFSRVDTFTFPKSGSEGSLFCVFSEFVCSCHVELLCTQVRLLSFDLSTWTRERHLFAENYTETHSWAAPASSFISTAHLVEKRPKVGDLSNLSIWWSDISSRLFPNRVWILRKKTSCWEQIFSADYVGRLRWTAKESAHTGISDKSDGIESALKTQHMKVT